VVKLYKNAPALKYFGPPSSPSRGILYQLTGAFNNREKDGNKWTLAGLGLLAGWLNQCFKYYFKP